ncbi:protein IQ-DOMAIN 31-like isoform X2 [Rhodamnia argentea]|uniref:Protein IQ-DOMAIN 31-like isoform X2 n=1 Tax=Rhodamnia argentea TaxID=178133 RepID=A0ABM3HS53_9MYRT|nr:protein IQ-DOMAIN 31-like isoform X2 [Rhodamnia argentea]
MGKSGGKWIKQVLFGKKSSKSRLVKKTMTEKEPITAFDASTEDLAPQSHTLPDELPLTGKRMEQSLELEKGDIHDVGQNAVPLLAGLDNVSFEGLNMSAAEIIRQEKAASKVQATFRGYLARRAFRVLKGIIRLQALIRGHLVRRQAIATLVCMRGIVNLQRLIRGRKDTYHVKTYGISTNFKPEKLLKNSFICKLLSSTTAMPLNIHYDPVEPNSTENWLECWSSTRFWEPLPQQKKAAGSRFQKHQSSTTSGETERNRTKRVSRRVPISNGDNYSVKPAIDIEKPNRGPRKTTKHKPEQVQEQPRNELEKVKGNLRKVAAASKEAHENPEALREKPKLTLMDLTFQSLDEDDKVVEDGAELHIVENMAVVGDSSLIQSETPPKPVSVGESVDVLLSDCPAVEAQLINDEKGDETLALHEGTTPKEDNTSKLSQKTKRRMSFPVKQEFSDNVALNTSMLPSYMAVTESAKAKLRANGSARISQDGVENGFVRRHSLPSLNDGKVSSMSPRMQKQVQVNGKVGSRTDRSLLSSKDSNGKTFF